MHSNYSKNFIVKKAFTMLELVFVVVVLGILVASIAPRFDRNNLQEAADQVISHIRYTQHLAMMDDRFTLDDSKWYKTRWQIVFSKNNGSDNQWSYTVFSDKTGTHSGNPDPKEIAKNPIDPNRYLTGGTSGNHIIHYIDSQATKELNIGHEYGIKDIEFYNCGSRARRVAFDYLGRPIKGNLKDDLSPYRASSSTISLLNKKCKITLSTSDNNITIAIEPETGYAHIL